MITSLLSNLRFFSIALLLHEQITHKTTIAQARVGTRPALLHIFVYCLPLTTELYAGRWAIPVYLQRTYGSVDCKCGLPAEP